MPRDQLPFGLAALRADGKAARQRTLKNAIQCSGTGLHTGAHVAMTLHPAKADTGIIFRRTDIAGGGVEIPARWDHVVDSRLCTSVGVAEGSGNGVTVATIEHLMAALAGLEIDNVIIEINGPEVPAMDGSAAPFMFLGECAGIVELPAPRRAIRILKPVTAAMNGSFSRLEPATRPSFAFEIRYDAPAIGRQAHTVEMSASAFRSEVARARTFGLLEDVADMRAHGFAKGGSLENAVVVSGDRVLNGDGLRYENEFVRHKLLDAIGDMYLAGGPIIGRFVGSCSGHALNNALLRALFADAEAWERVLYRVGPAAGETDLEKTRLRAAS